MIITIADTQVRPGSNLEHLEALAERIWRLKPSTIVHIGDNFDFPSVSYFKKKVDLGTVSLKADIEWGIKALKVITDRINKGNRKAKRRAYKPNLHFIMGNHEFRLQRYLDEHPELRGVWNLSKIIEDLGWTVHEFLEPCFVDNICFIHYLPNPESGKPIGGSIENKMNKTPHSFIHGHQQKFQFARRQRLDMKPHFGACAGSFYLEDEDYRGGKAGNSEIRGYIELHPFKNRNGFHDHDVVFVSMERMMQEEQQHKKKKGK